MPPADILFTHSYFLAFDPKEERAMMPYPPLGTITAAAHLRQRGFSVALHDVMFSKNEQDLRMSIERNSPKIVVLYDDSFNYLTKMCLSRMRHAAFAMIRIAREAGCTVAVFSSDSADHAEEYLNNGADYVLCGEAERTLAELCDMLFKGTDASPGTIPGLAFRDGGRLVRTIPRAVLKDLDALPMAAWDLVDIERYRAAWMKNHGYFSLNISTTRGCPFHCNWCAKPLYGQVYNTRSPYGVVAEMRELKESVRPDHLWITDDIFGLTPGWVETFSRIVRRERAVIPYKCLSRADLLLHGDTIRHLKESGCATVWIGAESGSQKVLDAMQKGTRIDQIISASRLLREHGIRVGFFLQFGYPGETREDIGKTIDLVHRCLPDEIGISVSYPLPGTPFYERVRSDMSLKKNWVDSEDLDLMFAGAYSPDFYRTLHRVVHKKFGIWRGLHSARRWVRQPLAPPPKLGRHVASLLYNAATLPTLLRKLNQQAVKA